MNFIAQHAPLNKPDILIVIENEGIKLKQRGHDYWMKHHGEKTASCKISSERQTFHCFGCGAHGDGIDLVMELHGLNFKDACQYLHIIPGQPMPVDPAKEKRRQLLKQFEEWRRHFYCQLCNERIEIDRLKMYAENRKPLPEYLAWWLAEKLGRLPLIELALDILSGNDDELKFQFYKQVKNGIF